MADLGCIVRAYDPTVTEKPAYLRENAKIHFYQIGLGHEKDGFLGETKLKSTTLEEMIAANGDSGKAITYLKMDIEKVNTGLLQRVALVQTL